MPTWKKVVISGSGVTQLANDANYLIDAQSGAILSGSFSGSFVGDGSQLTGVVADGTLSGSSQVTIQDTNGFSDLQSNISASFAVSSSAHTQREAIVNTLSGSAHTQRVAIESGLTTDISDLSGSAHTQRLAIESGLTTDISDLSGSAHTQRLAIENSLGSDISDLSGSAHTQRLAIENSLGSDISDLSGSAHTDRVAKVNTLSGSAHTQRLAIESALAADIATNASDIASLTGVSGTYATTGSNTFNGTQTISGSLYLTQDLVVQGSSSFINITASAVDIGTNTVILNTDTPSIRFGGISVYDSGSTGESGSLLWDSQRNHWVYEHPETSGAPYNSAVLISGPKNTGSLGEETELTNGKIPVAVGGDHIGDSIMTQTGEESITVNGQLIADGFTGSIKSTNGVVSGSSQVTITATTGYTAFSSSINADLDSNITDLSGSAHTDRVAKVNTLSGSAHTQRLAIESNLTTDISDLSGSAHTDRIAKVAVLSGSAHTQRLAIESTISTEQGIQDGRLDSLESFTASLDDTFATEAELNAATASLSGSAHTQRVAIESSLTTDISDLSGSAHTQRIALSSSLKAYTDSKVADLVDGAPEVLDTLNELAAAMGDDAAISASFATTLATKATTTSVNNLSGSAHTDRIAKINVLSGSAHAQRVAIESTINTEQGVQDGRLDSLESFTASLDDTFATEAELNTATASLSSSAHTQRLAIESSLTTDISDLSGSAHTDRVAKVNTLSGSAHTQRLAIENSLGSDITDLSGSAHTDRIAKINAHSSSAATAIRTEYVAADTALSASIATTISGLSQTLSVSGSAGAFDLDLLSEDLTINGEKGLTTNAAGNVVTITTEGSGIVSSSIEGDAQGQIKINGTNININELGTGDSPTFQNLTINGNLSTLGTVTNVNTTDLNIEDKFILLNSGSSTGNSGIVVQATSTQGRGSAFFWDSSANRWAFDHLDAEAETDIAAADAYAAAVVTSDNANYQKAGNIRVDTATGEAFIYVAE